MDAAVERGGLGAVIACVRPTGEVPWAARPSEGPSRGGNAHLCERDGAGSEAARAAWPGTARGPGRRRSQPRLATRQSRVAMFEKRACPYMGLHTTRANTHPPSLQFALVCPLPLFILYNYPPPYPGLPPPLVLITAGPCYGCRLQLLRFMLCVSYSSLPSIFCSRAYPHVIPQSARGGPPTSRCCWRTSGRRWRICCSTLRVSLALPPTPAPRRSSHTTF